VNTQTVLTVASVVLGGGFIGSLVQAFKARPERDAVVIVPWQKLNEALGTQNDRLRADYGTERDARLAAEREVERVRALLDSAQARVDLLERTLARAGLSLPPENA
jgi:hypothetical protein